jgi:carboxymethylenebutenolidase
MTTSVSIPSKSKLTGARAEPAGADRAGGVVVVQEWWGISDFIKLTCERLAQEGFVALAPDLYHGAIAQSKAEAAQRMGALDQDLAIAEVGDAAAYLKKDARCNGRVAVLGFCMGGGIAFTAAATVGGFAAAVPFYGLPQLPTARFGAVKVPIQAHFAKMDDWAKASVAEGIRDGVRAGGGAMDLFVYDAGHAFMRSTDPEVYSEANARVAWTRVVDFLKKHLG